MQNQKTIKSFVDDISVFANDLIAAGFVVGETNARGNRLPIGESHKQFFSFIVPDGSMGFYNVSSKPADVLAILFPDFKPNEVNELASFLVFMSHLFTGEEISVHTVMDFTIDFEAGKLKVVSELFDLNIQDGDFVIRPNTLNKNYVRPYDVDFQDIMQALKKSFKRNITFYFEDIMKLDNSIVSKMFNESVEDYFWRKNNNPVLKRLTDAAFVDDIIQFGVRNVVRSKVPSFEAYGQNSKMIINKLYNKYYVAELSYDFNKEHVLEFSFEHHELRQMKHLFKSIIQESELNVFFQIIELYIFKLKIEGRIDDNDKIKCIRYHVKKLDKKTSTDQPILKVSLLDLSFNFTDVIRMKQQDFLGQGADAMEFISDNFENLYQSYSSDVIRSISQEFGIPINEVNYNSLLVHQMANI